MEEAGWLRAQWTTKENGRRLRVYRLTEARGQQLCDEEARRHAVISAVNRTLRMA
jgi:PadR family transcriptional regulator, regulatory protein PadR